MEVTIPAIELAKKKETIIKTIDSKLKNKEGEGLSGNEFAVILAFLENMQRKKKLREYKLIFRAIEFNNMLYPGTFHEGIIEAQKKCIQRGYLIREDSKLVLSKELLNCLLEFQKN